MLRASSTFRFSPSSTLRFYGAQRRSAQDDRQERGVYAELVEALSMTHSVFLILSFRL